MACRENYNMKIRMLKIFTSDNVNLVYCGEILTLINPPHKQIKTTHTHTQTSNKTLYCIIWIC